MQRVLQVVFVIAVLLLSWLGMMVVHELGHVIGAVLTQGVVTNVVLHPLSISRTDVQPNPVPSVVVWLGPLVGVLLPLFVSLIPWGEPLLKNLARFFAGFCLTANGAYIALGSFEGIGDCGEMLRTGTPIWLMLLFGASTITAGFYLWHTMGSARQFFANPDMVSWQMVVITVTALVVVVIVELALSR